MKGRFAVLTAAFFLTQVVFSDLAAAFSVSPPSVPSFAHSALLSDLTERLSAVADVDTSRAETGETLVVLIRDVHLNPSAQRNIAAVLVEIERIARARGGRLLVGAEGGEGRFDFTPYRLFPPFAAVAAIADRLLSENLISAVSHFGLTARGATVVGVEDPLLYKANVSALRRAWPDRRSVSDEIKKRRRAAARALASHSPVLAALVEAIRRYDTAPTSLAALVSTLRPFVDEHRFPELIRFSDLAAAETAFTSPAAQRRTVSLATAMKGAMPPFHPGGVSLESLHAAAVAAGVSETDRRWLERLLAHHRAVSVMKARPILRAVRRAIPFALKSAATSAVERSSVRVFLALRTAEEAAGFRLASGDPSELERAAPYLPDPYVDFYRAAWARDRAIADRFSGWIAAMDSPVTALVAGGFHTDGIARRLQEAGHAVAVVTPRFAGAAGDHGYLAAHMETVSPLDRRFAGRSGWLAPAKLHLGARRWFGGAPAALAAFTIALAAYAGIDGAVSAGEATAIAAASLGLATRVRWRAGRVRLRLDDGSVLDVAPSPPDRTPEVAPPARFAAYASAAVLPPAFAATTSTSILIAALIATNAVLFYLLIRGYLRRETPRDVRRAAVRLAKKRAILHRLEKEFRAPGTQDLRSVAIVSDPHGAIDKFDRFLVHAIARALPGRLPADFKLDPIKPIGDQLRVHNIGYRDLRKAILFHNLGDIPDRGDDPVKVFLRTQELVEQKIMDFVVGNHDQFMFMNLQGFHLPYYDGYDTHGYADRFDDDPRHGKIDRVIRDHHRTDPRTRTKAWWAEKLSAFTHFHQDKQKTFWEPRVNAKIQGDGGLFHRLERAIDGRPAYRALWERSENGHKRLWDKLRGWYLVDVYTGSRAVGEMSVVWWTDLLEKFEAAWAEVQASADYDAANPSDVDQAWVDGIALIKDVILPELNRDLASHLAKGEWWWRAFEALNAQNYTSPEWYAKDWIFHKGWGPGIIEELNRFYANDPTRVVTDANYLDDPYLKAMADFFKREFNLHVRDVYLNDHLHAFLPMDPDTGEFHFTYQGREYRGKSVWKGLARISRDVKTKPISESGEALTLVTGWYADNTTEVKETDVAAAIRKFGADHLAEVNGFNRLFTGHLPFYKFANVAVRPVEGEDERWNRAVMGFNVGGRIFFTDHGMGGKFGGRGGWISAGPDGLELWGIEHEAIDEIVRAPRTLRQPDATDDAVIFHNPGLTRSEFLPQLIAEYEAEIAADRKALRRLRRSYGVGFRALTTWTAVSVLWLIGIVLWDPASADAIGAALAIVWRGGGVAAALIPVFGIWRVTSDEEDADGDDRAFKRIEPELEALGLAPPERHSPFLGADEEAAGALYSEEIRRVLTAARAGRLDGDVLDRFQGTLARLLGARGSDNARIDAGWIRRLVSEWLQKPDAAWALRRLTDAIRDPRRADAPASVENVDDRAVTMDVAMHRLQDLFLLERRAPALVPARVDLIARQLLTAAADSQGRRRVAFVDTDGGAEFDASANLRAFLVRHGRADAAAAFTARSAWIFADASADPYRAALRLFHGGRPDARIRAYPVRFTSGFVGWTFGDVTSHERIDDRGLRRRIKILALDLLRPEQLIPVADAVERAVLAIRRIRTAA